MRGIARVLRHQGPFPGSLPRRILSLERNACAGQRDTHEVMMDAAKIKDEDLRGSAPGGQRARMFNSRNTERARLVEVQTSASPSTTTEPVRATFHGRAPFRTEQLVL